MPLPRRVRVKPRPGHTKRIFRNTVILTIVFLAIYGEFNGLWNIF